jgi:hypothetical protein
MHIDMSTAQQVLRPVRLVKPDDILAYVDEHMITRCLYGWWFDEALPVPRDNCYEIGGKYLLYIGIAPSAGKATTSAHVKRRLWRNHVCGAVRGSTLRLSLAALLKDELDLSFYRDSGNRIRMPKDCEEKLTSWIKRHAAISLMQHNTPWELERELLQNSAQFPLNIILSNHPLRVFN